MDKEPGYKHFSRAFIEAVKALIEAFNELEEKFKYLDDDPTKLLNKEHNNETDGH